MGIVRAKYLTDANQVRSTQIWYRTFAVFILFMYGKLYMKRQNWLISGHFCQEELFLYVNAWKQEWTLTFLYVQCVEASMDINMTGMKQHVEPVQGAVAHNMDHCNNSTIALDGVIHQVW
jgi:hypothetical protein